MEHVVVLIPTYNEADNISRLLPDLLKRIKRYPSYRFSILVVDDTSPDGTGDIVKDFSKKYKNIYLLSGKKEGLGKAMIRGYSYAIQKLRADVVITNEADFAFDFKDIGYMLKKIKVGADVVVASRHKNRGKTEGWTWSRKLNHWVANTVFATWIAGVHEVSDHNGAFRAVRVKGVLDKIYWNKMNVRGFGFFFYSLYLFTTLTHSFDEFPVIYRFRTQGESKVSFNPKYIKTYIRDVVEYMRLAFHIRHERSIMLNRNGRA